MLHNIKNITKINIPVNNLIIEPNKEVITEYTDRVTYLVKNKMVIDLGISEKITEKEIEYNFNTKKAKKNKNIIKT